RISRPPAGLPARARPLQPARGRAAAPGPRRGADRRGAEGVGAGLPALPPGRRYRRRPSAGRETGPGAAGPGPRPDARDLDRGAAGRRGRAPGAALLAGALSSRRALVGSAPDRSHAGRPRPPRTRGPAQPPPPAPAPGHRSTPYPLIPPAP